MARPPLLTEQVHKNFVAAVANGIPPRVAAMAVRISFSTFRYWMRRGRKAQRKQQAEQPLEESETLYLKFYEDVCQAEAIFQMTLVRELVTAVKEHHDVGTAKWLLERRFAKDWLPKQRALPQGEVEKNEGPVEFILTVPRPAALSGDGFGEEAPAALPPTTEDTKQ